MVLKFLPVVSVEFVKARMTNVGATLDADILKVINAVSEEAAGIAERDIDASARGTTIIELAPHKRWVSLTGYPITSVTSVRYADRPDFASVEAFDPSTYSVFSARGQIHLRELSFWYEPGFLEVVYTGGMALSTEDFMTKWPREAEAAANEVVNRLSRAAMPDGNAQHDAAGGVTHTGELHTLKDFRAAFARRRRPYCP